MNGVYWGLVALCIMGRQDALDRDDMIRYVMSCWDEDMGQSRHVYPCTHLVDLLRYSCIDPDTTGAFGAHPKHDGHLLSTLSGIQILAIQDSLDIVDTDRLVKCKPPLDILFSISFGADNGFNL